MAGQNATWGLPQIAQPKLSTVCAKLQNTQPSPRILVQASKLWVNSQNWGPRLRTSGPDTESFGAKSQYSGPCPQHRGAPPSIRGATAFCAQRGRQAGCPARRAASRPAVRSAARQAVRLAARPAARLAAGHVRSESKSCLVWVNNSKFSKVLESESVHSPQVVHFEHNPPCSKGQMRGLRRLRP